MNDKLLVSFTPEQRELIDSLEGLMGNSKAEVVRVIVMSWLSEKGYLEKQDKLKSGGMNLGK